MGAYDTPLPPRGTEDVAVYTASLVGELVRLTEHAGLPMLAFLLGMAREEALAQIERRKVEGARSTTTTAHKLEPDGMLFRRRLRR